MPNGVELATAWVRIVPSMSGVQSAVATQMGPAAQIAGAQGTKAGQTFGQKFGAGFKSNIKAIVAGAGIGFGVAAVGKWIGDSAAAVKEWGVINAQSAAVVKSTGGVANISAAQVHNLAQSIESVTATQAEAIQSGANMLLTFKNIRNETGKGNDIFTQSTKTLVDLSRAMGTDPKTAAIQLGKALNDPIKGITALSRVGIQFTEDQKDVIKSLVQGGDVMGAQKIILKELNSQFGGSGAAYAKTYAGKMYLLGDAVGDLGEKMISLLFPAFLAIAEAATAAFGWATDNLPLLGAVAGGILLIVAAVQAHNAAMAIAAAGGLIQWMKATQIATAVQWLWNAAMSANPIGIIVLAIAAAVAALVWFFTQTELGQEIWKNVTTAIANAAKWLWESVIQPVFQAIGAIWNWIYQNVIVPVVNGIIVYARAWGAIFNWLWANVIKPVASFIGTAVRTIGDVVGRVFGAIGGIIRGAFNGVVGFVRGIFNSIIGVVNGVIRGINAVGGAVRAATGGAINIRLGLIPSLAKGGIALPVPGGHLVNVAEAGKPEAILPLDRLDDLLDGEGGGTTIYQENHITTPPNEDPRVVARGLSREFAAQIAGRR